MTELIKLLCDAIGIKPLLPVVLILLTGLLFKAVREYPFRDLVHDRWFLLAGLIIISSKCCICHLQISSLRQHPVPTASAFMSPASKVIHPVRRTTAYRIPSCELISESEGLWTLN